MFKTCKMLAAHDLHTWPDGGPRAWDEAGRAWQGRPGTALVPSLKSSCRQPEAEAVADARDGPAVEWRLLAMQRDGHHGITASQERNDNSKGPEECDLPDRYGSQHTIGVSRVLPEAFSTSSTSSSRTVPCPPPPSLGRGLIGRLPLRCPKEVLIQPRREGEGRICTEAADARGT